VVIKMEVVRLANEVVIFGIVFWNHPGTIIQ